MVIDVSQPKTYPTELERIVSEYFTELPATIKDKIRSEKIKYNVDVRCAIEDYVGIFKADSLYNQLLDIMKELEKYPYEISLERKAVSRIIHNLIDTAQYAVFSDKTGVWVEQE